MSYGTGCDNKGNIVSDEKTLKEDMKNKSEDSSWTGEIIGYKLTPLYKIETRKVFVNIVKKRTPAKRKRR